jgi:hypothetical protein
MFNVNTTTSLGRSEQSTVGPPLKACHPKKAIRKGVQLDNPVSRASIPPPQEFQMYGRHAECSMNGGALKLDSI